MRFFDVHTHILPGVDDGAKNKEESLELIKMLKKQGITDIILTPHFYTYQTSLEKFIAKRNKAFEEIKDYFDENKIIAHLGAEVYFLDTLFGLEDISELCIEESNYILIELPFNERNTKKVLSMLNRLSATFQVVPILAHIEKYPVFFNREFLTEAKKMDCLVQFDIESLKFPLLRKKIKGFIEQGYIQFAGSDCHDIKERKPNIDIMKKYLPQIMCEFVFDNSNITF